MDRRFAALIMLALLATVDSRVGSGQNGGSATGSIPQTVIQRDDEVAVSQPGPRGGGGDTIAYPFFLDVPGFGTAFRKRVLQKGSAVGYGPQEFDEIYYILSGTGQLTVNGARQTVEAGTAILKRPGNSYGLQQTGSDDLVMIVTYRRPSAASVPDAGSVHRIIYGTEATSFGELRVPAGAGPFPIAVLIHGGCWLAARSGLADMRPLAGELASRGVATWNVEYRRVGHVGGGWPGSFRDLSEATDYLRELAVAYPIDIARTIIVGHSSGGHFAAWLAARHRLPPGSPLTGPSPLRLSGLVTLDAFLDPRVMDSRSINGQLYCDEPVLARLLGGEPDAVPDRLRQASPLALLPWGMPQEYVVSSLRYPVVPARALANGRTTMAVPDYPALARAAGDRVAVEIIPEADHYDFLKPQSKAWDAVVRAILRALGQA